MPCVTHLGLHKGPAGLRAVDSTAAVALRGKAHQRACVCAVPGSDAGPGGFVCVCGVNTNPDKGRAGLGCSATGLPWQIHGAHGGEMPACGVCATRAAYAPS